MPLTDTLLARIETAAGTLPEGFIVRIEVENGSAFVRLIRPDESDIIIDDGESDLCECFREACIVARDEHAAGKHAEPPTQDEFSPDAISAREFKRTL